MARSPSPSLFSRLGRVLTPFARGCAAPLRGVRRFFRHFVSEADMGPVPQDDVGEILTDLNVHGVKGLWYLARTILDRESRRKGGKFYQHPQDEQVREIARELMKYNSLAQGIVTGLRSYVLGDQGLQMEVKVSPAATGAAKQRANEVSTKLSHDEADADVRAVELYLKQFRDADNWWSRERESFERWHRDGEVFIRFFPPAGDDSGPVKVRYIEPEFVWPPDGSAEWTYGCLNAVGPDGSQDTETIVAYNVQYTAGAGTYVDAASVVHLKANVDRVIKRGTSDFTSTAIIVMEALRCLQNILKAETIRGSTTWITQHPDSVPADVAAWIAGTQTDYTVRPSPWSGTSGGREIPVQETTGVGEVHLTGNQKFAAMPAAERLGETVQLINAALLAVGAKYHMPLWIISGDASRNNSVDIEAGSPFGNYCKEEQQLFGLFVRDVHWKVVEYGVERGDLRESVLTSVDLKFVPQPPVVRDRKGETERRAILHQARVMSRTTWQTAEGLDPEHEKEQFEKEREQQQPVVPSIILPKPVVKRAEQPAQSGQANGQGPSRP